MRIKHLRGGRTNIVILVRLRVGVSVDINKFLILEFYFSYSQYSPCFGGQSTLEIRFSRAKI